MINTIFLILIIIIIFYTFNHYLKSKNLIKFEKFKMYSNYNPTQYYRDTTGNNILPIDSQYSLSFETFKELVEGDAVFSLFFAQDLSASFANCY